MKSKFLSVLVVIALMIAASLGTFFILDSTGSLDLSRRTELTYKLNTIRTTYTGTEIDPIKVNEDAVELVGDNQLRNGDSVIITSNTRKTDVGAYTYSVQFKFVDAFGIDVSNLYKVTVDDSNAGFVVLKKTVKVYFKDNTIEYDGNSHTKSIKSIDGLCYGHQVVLNNTNFTTPGTYDDSVDYQIYDQSLNNVTANYDKDISDDDSKLIITKRSIKIVPEITEKTFDDLPMEFGNPVIANGSLVDGHRIDSAEYTEFIKKMGNHNIPYSIVIKDEDGNDVTSYYNFGNNLVQTVLISGIEKPVIKGDEKYTCEELYPFLDADTNGYKIYLYDNSILDDEGSLYVPETAGTYTAKVKLDEGFTWKDGTEDSFDFTFKCYDTESDLKFTISNLNDDEIVYTGKNHETEIIDHIKDEIVDNNWTLIKAAISGDNQTLSTSLDNAGDLAKAQVKANLIEVKLSDDIKKYILAGSYMINSDDIDISIYTTTDIYSPIKEEITTKYSVEGFSFTINKAMLTIKESTSFTPFIKTYDGVPINLLNDLFNVTNSCKKATVNLVDVDVVFVPGTSYIQDKNENVYYGEGSIQVAKGNIKVFDEEGNDVTDSFDIKFKTEDDNDINGNATGKFIIHQRNVYFTYSERAISLNNANALNSGTYDSLVAFLKQGITRSSELLSNEFYEIENVSFHISSYVDETTYNAWLYNLYSNYLTINGNVEIAKGTEWNISFNGIKFYKYVNGEKINITEAYNLVVDSYGRLYIPRV